MSSAAQLLKRAVAMVGIENVLAVKLQPHLAAALGEAGYDALARLVRETPAFGISYPDSATGIALAEQLWAEAAR